MLKAVRIWIWLSTLLVASGWILSAFRQLNPAGYGVAFVLAAVLVFFHRRAAKEQQKKNPAQWVQIFKCRFKRWAPLLFLALVFLTLLGGSLYAPSNGSSTSYRIPRVMNWLAAGQWYWIHTLDVRMNIAGSGMEWFFAPLILLTHSDRFLFLPNWFSFLLLPGLIFGVFTRLRISPRVAWWWMWLLPSGWCFIMQAGSTINDSFAAVYALAAVDFGLRARESQRAEDLWLSLLSAALAAGVKQSDMLLAVPGLIAALPGIWLLLKRPLSSVVVAALCLLVSGLPTIIFNLKKTGNWAGVTANAWGNAELKSPVWGILGNIFCMTAQNLKPPVFPFAKPWNAAMKHFLQTPFGSHFVSFEDFGRLSFGVGESAAALGAGVCFFVLLSFFAARHYGKKFRLGYPVKNVEPLLKLLRWIPWVLLLAFMAKIGTFENGRQFASYYILFFPSLLASPGQSFLVRQRWWKLLALLLLMSAVGLLVISRDRPLFPAQAVIARLQAKYPNSKFVSNIALTYAETPAFWEEQKYFREVLPAEETKLGYATWMDGQAGSSLWLPYGQRRVYYVLPDDTAEQVRSMGIRYVVVESRILEMTQDTLPQWLERYHAVLVTQRDFIIDPYEPAETFYLVRLENR